MSSGAAAGRLGSYSSRADVDTIEELSKRLTADLRKHIRALGPCDVLSERWIEVGDCLGRVASISQMEKGLPKAEDASLWDCEELALRYVLEDGKLNLCLRLLDEYQEFVSKHDRVFTVDQIAHLDKFEIGVSALLANAWLHAEALQTSDLPLVFRIITTTLRGALADTAVDSYNGKLPAAAVLFLFDIAKALDAIGERKIFAELLSQDVLSLLIRHLAANHDKLRPVELQKGAEALALFASAEDFSTNKARLVGGATTIPALATLDFVSTLAETPDAKRKLRPLLDLIAEAKRKASK